MIRFSGTVYVWQNIYIYRRQGWRWRRDSARGGDGVPAVLWRRQGEHNVERGAANPTVETMAAELHGQRRNRQQRRLRTARGRVREGVPGTPFYRGGDRAVRFVAAIAQSGGKAREGGEAEMGST